MDLIDKLLEFIMYEDPDNPEELANENDDNINDETIEKLKEIKDKKDILKDASASSPEIPKPQVSAYSQGKSWKSSRTVELESGIEIVKPRHFEERSGVVESMKSHRSIVVNLECLDRDTARRLLDYICGAAYALDVSVQRVANLVYLFSPSGIEVTCRKS